jgi:HAMP domain-containing protein
MTDIVERLRTWDDIYRHSARPGSDLLAEAADEIERLRAMIEKDDPEKIANASLHQRAALMDEIEWLRAAVNRVIEDLEMAVFCDGHTRLQPCEPNCHCVSTYDAVRALIR